MLYKNVGKITKIKKKSVTKIKRLKFKYAGCMARERLNKWHKIIIE